MPAIFGKLIAQKSQKAEKLFAIKSTRFLTLN